jgi:serine protease
MFSVRNVVAALLLFVSVAHAQQRDAMPNAVNILMKPEAARALRPVFATLRSENSNIQDIVAADSTITSILSLPVALHGLSIKPFFPEHSVVFEDIREHLNPGLFADRVGRVSSPDPLLRSSEDRLSRWFVLRYDNDLAPEVVAQLCKKSPAIEAVEPIYAAHPCFKPNDSLIGQQYALPLIHAFEAWDHVRCDSTMIVADVDLGVQLDHPDLAQAFWKNPGETGLDSLNRNKRTNGVDDDGDGFIDDWQGWDFGGSNDRNSDNNPNSTFDHGSHTSGILAATGNNGRGIAGVAFGASVIPIKTCSDQIETIYYGYPGIVYASDRGARVINCSWAELYHSLAGQDVVDYAYARGSIVVAAAGNDGLYNDYYPASYDRVISVGGVDDNRKVANFNHNPRIAVSAPGVLILSTIAGSMYGNESGTSMACPEVAGAIALVLQSSKNGLLHSVYPDMTARMAAEQVRATVRPFANDPNPGFNGKGVIDIERAVTDTQTYSVRVESMKVVDHTFLNPGQSGFLQLTLRNYLRSISNGSVRVESMDESLVKIESTPIPIVVLLPNGTITTDPQKTSVSVPADAPPGSRTYLRVIVSAQELGYVDTDYVEFKIGQPYVTLDHNNVAISLYENGAVGHSQFNDNTGDGLVWHHPPSSIGIANHDLLYQGGLIVAANISQIVDNLAGEGSGFSRTARVAKESITTPSGGEKGSAAFSDSLVSTSGRVNMDVMASAYEFTNAPNAVILQYEFRPTDTTHNFNAGLYMDWDLGEGGFNNYALFDESDSIFYIHRANAGYPVVAMKLIEQPIGSMLNYYAINRDSEKTLSDSVEWKILTTRKRIAGYTDIATVLGATGMDFANANPAKLTYAIGLGESLPSAKEAVKGAAGIYGGLSSVEETKASSQVDVWPNPTSGLLHLPREVNSVTVNDALGRMVYRSNHSANIDLSDLPPGAYRIVAPAEGWARTIIRQ